MKLLLVEANDVNRWVGGRAGGRNVHVIPIALMGLAADVMQQVPGTEVRLVESSLDCPTDEAWLRLLQEFSPDVIGLRGINFFQEEARRLVQGAALQGPTPVILGGPIATALKEQVFQAIPELRYAAVGDGESILRAVAQGTPPNAIAGMLWRAPLGVRHNPAVEPVADLDSLALPDYSLVDICSYSRHLSYAYNQRRQGVLITSRGCPYRCSYCFQPYGQKVRMRSAHSVFGEIETLVARHQIKDFYIVDDIFNVNRQRAMEVFNSLIEAKLGVRLYFVNGLRIDRCDREFIDRMVAAGTVWVTFAIESAHPRIQQLIRKEIDLPLAHEVIAYTQSLGIVVNVNTMFGFPTETAAEAQVTLDWLGALPRPSLLPYHFNLRGFPGCEIVEQAAAAGWDREAFLASGSSSYNDLPPGSPTFSRKEMLEHWLQFHERFGMQSREHMQYSVRTLGSIGYSDAEIVAMYSVLLNRVVSSVDDLLDPARCHTSAG
jgi:radical SAM superfamily enzyme YgiQ (UPF0313 family)